MTKKKLSDSDKLKEQIKRTKFYLLPEADMHTGLVEFAILIEMFFKYLEETMNKKPPKGGNSGKETIS